ncbi:phage virion morphogenesis protein [Chroococcidiopsis sp.]|uniref:phage virion morphogenesis protein n=1 Tax=Chroococcidiopsis sp. TaxID=3088168 RepID=UPI003F2C54FA
MIKIEVTQDKTAAMLKSFKSKVRDLSPPLEGFANYLKKETEQQFEQEKDPEGDRWANLAPSTLTQKRRLGYPDKILTRTGKMRKSVRVAVSNRNLIFAIATPYATYHQEGTKKMPQRKILGLTSVRLNELGGLVRTYIKGRR